MQNFENYNDINECTSRGSCSVSPAIVALEELAVCLLQYLSCYLILLENLGASNEKIKYEVVSVIAALVSANEFSENQLCKIIKNVFIMLTDTKDTYLKLSRDLGENVKNIRGIPKMSGSTSVAKIIALGEKLLIEYMSSKYQNIKSVRIILLMVIKSVCLTAVKISDYNSLDGEFYHKLLTTLSIINSPDAKYEILNDISYWVGMDRSLRLMLCDLLIREYGKISKVSVSHSTRKSKAILVSGDSFSELLKILELTKDNNIDVYTHSGALIAHSFERFRRYNHMVGHFGGDNDNCILDFATFPGAILLTKNSHANNEYFYRGRLFSSDYIVPKGVVKVDNSDFRDVVSSALQSKGFSKGKIKKPSVIGYNIADVEKCFNNIASGLKSKNIKRLYIIGINPHSEIQKLYYNEFFSKLSDDEFVISFSYSADKDNVLTINIGNCMPVYSFLLKKLFEIVPINAQSVYFLGTTCDVMSISSIIYLKNNGAKNVFLYKCSPTVINPSVLSDYAKMYDIKFLSKCDDDLICFRK